MTSPTSDRTSPRHLSLTAGQLTEVTFPWDAGHVEILNVSGGARVYVRVDGVPPQIAGQGSEVLPAAISSVKLPVSTDGPTVVRLIADGATDVSVKAL